MNNIIIFWFFLVVVVVAVVKSRMTSSGDATAKAGPAADSTTTPTTTTSTEHVDQLSSARESSWPAVLFYIHLNILGLYGIIILFTNTYLTTVIFTTLLTLMGIVGVTCGAHRLWAHQTFKANTFLRIILMLCQTMAGQVCKFRLFIDFIFLFIHCAAIAADSIRSNFAFKEPVEWRQCGWIFFRFLCFSWVCFDLIWFVNYDLLNWIKSAARLIMKNVCFRVRYIWIIVGHFRSEY